MGEHESSRFHQPEQSPQGEFIHPYLNVIREQYADAFPLNSTSMNEVIDHIGEQTEKNYTTFESQRYPGVEVPYTKIDITPDLINSITGENYQVTPSNPDMLHPEHYSFLFAGQTLPRDGHAFTTVDMALDRTIRALPRVAFPLRAGETVPDVSIVMLGLPNGLGGHVTRDFFKAVDREGFAAHGKLDAELIEHLTGVQDMTPEQLEMVRMRFDGVSKGAVIADRTLSQLLTDVPGLEGHIQTHLFNPAGSHEPGILSTPVKGAQVLGGLAGEMVARGVNDPIMKALMKEGPAYTKALEKRFDIQPDEWSQQALKYATFASEGLHLVKGSPLDTDAHRHHILGNKEDPLTTGITRIARAASHARAKAARFRDGGTSPIIAHDRGRSTEYIVDQGHHIFTYNSPERYNQIFTNLQTPQASNAT